MNGIVFFVIGFIILIIVGGYFQKQHDKIKAASLVEKLSRIENFKVSKKVDGYRGLYFFGIDNESEKIVYFDMVKNITNIFKFSDIIGVEIIEDGSAISKKSATRTIGGAIIGGVLGGGVGSIVGGLSGNSEQKNKVSTLSVKILVRNMSFPSLTIKCFDSKTMTSGGKKSIETNGKLESYIYREGKQSAEQIKDILSVIIDKEDRKQNNNATQNKIAKPSSSIADELQKLSDLKDKGILSEEEFAVQKDRILNN